MNGSALIRDTRVTVPASEPLSPFLGRRVRVAVADGRAVLLVDGEVLWPQELPEYALVDSVDADEDPADPAPEFNFRTLLDDGDPYGEWIERRSAAHTALMAALRAAGYRMPAEVDA